MYHIERSVFELSRTKDLSSIQFTRPLNQIEQTKNIRIEKNQMFSLNVSRKTSGTRLECIIFERVRLSLAIERSGTLYRKTRVEQNRAADQALKHPRRFEVLFLSYIGTCMQPCIRRPVFKVPIFRSYKRCICYLH